MIQYLSKIFKRAIIYALVMAINTANAQTDPSLLFAKGFGNEFPGGGANQIFDIKIDGSGNRYMTGYFTGTADFDLGVGVANLTGAGSTDIFLAKYDASGNYLWAKSMGGTGNDEGASLALDGIGNVQLTGYFSGTADFDPGVGTANLTGVGFTEIFLAKYDASGNYTWAKGMGGTDFLGNRGTSLCLDGSGNVLMTGSFSGTTDFDPGVGTANLTSAGNTDIFLAKYNASGNYVWTKSMGGTDQDAGKSIALDGSGNILLTGYFNGTNAIDFDPGAGTANLTGAGVSDLFFAKYNASGDHVWAKGIGGIGSDRAASLVLDGSGHVLLTGYFYGTVDFDPGAGTADLISVGGNDEIFFAKYDAAGNYVWAKRLGGTGYDQGTSLALDGSGNLLLSGFFSGTADFDPGDNTANLTSAGFPQDIFLAKYDASGNYVWAIGMGGTDADAGASLALDGTGNVYVAGVFINTVDFDPGVGTSNRNTGTNTINGFVAAYTSVNGTYVSVGALNSTTPTNIASQAITRDGSGNVYVTGNFSGSVDFDPGAGSANLTSAGGSDIFLAKYNASGNYIWAISMGGTVNFGDGGNSLALDGSGNVLLTGYFSGTADFDPGVGVTNLTSVGFTDIFLAKYDASGNYVWARGMGGTPPNGDRGISLALDGSGNVLLTGYFSGTADFDPGAGTANLTSAGGNDIFLAKYNASGIYEWAKRMGGTNVTGDRGNSIALDVSGNVLLTGNFSGTADFDPGDNTANLTSAGGNDIFLAKYDASGNYVWAKGMGGTLADQGTSLVTDGSGNVVLTGSFNGTADFNPGDGTANQISAGDTDIFLAKYDASGNYLWAKSVGGTGADRGASLALDGSGNVVLTGHFNGTDAIDFDPDAGTDNLTGMGGDDIFLAQYDASGNYVWAKGMGGTAADQGTSLVLDGSGNVLLTGVFNGTADFDPSAGTTNLTSMSGGQYGFIAAYATSSCTNPTVGGTIAAAQSGTNPFNPAAFTSTVAASGESGTLEYKWQSSTTSNSVGFADIASSNSATYDAGSLTVTTWFKRLARVDCSADWTGAGESNVLEVMVTPTASAQTFCGSKTVADLVATGTALKWYDVAINGSALASTTAIASGTYYVSQTVSGNESERTSVEVTVTPSTTTGSVTTSACASYTWPANGLTYTSSQTNLTHTVDCNTATLNLTITAQLQWYLDADSDGYYTGAAISSCVSPGSGYTITVIGGNDCDDANALVWRTASFYVDADADGYSPSASSEILCYGTTTPSGYAVVTLGLDCDDMIAAVNPGHVEVLYNGIDDNCDGQLDEGNQAKTTLQSVSCGATLSSMGSLIYANINYSASGYRFKVVNNTTGDIQYVDNSQHWFALNWLVSYDYVTAYTVSVQLQIAGVWVGYYGTSCLVNSPDITSSTGSLQLISTQCGVTLPSIGTILYTTAQSGATGYRFRITDVTPNATGDNLVQEKERSYHWFGLTMLTRYNYGSTYMVEVAVKTTGGYTGYGSPCYVNTPAVPMLANCGAVIPTRRTLVYTVATKSVTQYRFQVTNVSDQSSITFDTGRFWFSFRVNVPVHTPNSLYSVRVAVMTAGNWSPFGDACQITSPAVARTDGNAQLDFAANVFPNPYSDQFNLLVNTDSDERISYRVYDMLGKLIEADEFDYTALETKEFGRNYPAGVYNIIVSQGEERKTLRIIKR